MASVESTRRHTGKVATEHRCFISRLPADENPSRLRRIALNQLQLKTTGQRSIRLKRLTAAWDHD